MGFDGWLTVGVIAVLMAVLVRGRIGPDTALLGALAFLMLCGVVDPVKAVSGFAHPSVIMIAALFVVATGLTETGALSGFGKRVLGRPRTAGGAIARLMSPVAVLSAFLNNTPVVAMNMPVVQDFARATGISPSRLFMPLSFAAMLGGCCTLVGTSSNITINELYKQYVRENSVEMGGRFGLAEMSVAQQFWAVSAVGVPVCVVGIVFVCLLSRRLLPERSTPGDCGGDGDRRYTVEVVVPEGSPLVGKTVEGAGLRHLPGLYLVEIERGGRVVVVDGVRGDGEGGGEILAAVGPEERLEAGDRLVFVGVVESVVDLLKVRGLEPASGQAAKVAASATDRVIVEAVVSSSAPFVRKMVRSSRFRTRYNAAILAVHRGGQRIEGKIGDIVLQPGDTLLLSTHRGFVEAQRNSANFYLVSSMAGARPVRHERAKLAIGVTLLTLGLLTVPMGWVMGKLNSVFGLSLPVFEVHPITAVFVGASLMVLTRCTTGTLARGSINWQVLLVIGAALGVGRALNDSGAAVAIAELILGVTRPMGVTATLAAVCVLAVVFTQLVTNNGVAVLMFPIAMATAADLGVSPLPFAIALMLTSACAFMTPIGYQTNLMVQGPGGYRFTDFVRLGLPLTLVCVLIVVLLTPIVYPFAGSGGTG